MSLLTLPLIARMQARRFTIPLTGAIRAGEIAPLQEDLQTGFHFWCDGWTATYPTRQATGSPLVPADDGVTRLAARFKDKSHQINLTTENMLDLATLAAPGRQRYPGLSGDPSQSLHIPYQEWPYLYEAKGGIVVEVANNSNLDLETGDVNFTFIGFLIPTAVVPSGMAFWDIVLSTMPVLKQGLSLPAG